MPDLILYLLKINIALILFYLAYRFALRRLTFYTLNRFFLVAGIIFSSIYPFVELSELLRKNPVLNDRLIVLTPDYNAVQQIALQQLPVQAAAFDYWQLIIALFWAGVVLMALRLSIQLISLYRIHRNSTPENSYNFKFRRIEGKVNPFSFWQSIYLNPDQHEQEELKAILKHEQVHIDEWHTLDIILAELSIIFYWFNPGVWLMKQAVRENLEFITDRKVLQSGMDSKMYQYSLVQISSLPKSYALANNFNFMSIKKRIMMMNKKESSKMQISRYALMLPLVILLTLVFTISKAQLEKKPINRLKERGLSVIHSALSTANSGINEIISKVANDAFAADTSKKISSTDTIDYGKIKIEQQIAYIKSMRPPAFRVSIPVDTPKTSIQIRNMGTPLFIIDGLPSTAARFNRLNMTDIKDIALIKDGAAAGYGDRGINGVVFVTTKSGSAAIDTTKNVVRTLRGEPLTFTLTERSKPQPIENIITITRGAKEPLYVIDGIIADSIVFKRLKPGEIEAISILKEGSATIYGDRGKEGIILITTKRTATGDFLKSIKSSNKLLIIYGKEATLQQREDLNPVGVNVRILVDEGSIKEYGEKGKNGVIIISNYSN